MTGLNPAVDHYLAVGCGRCALVGTPQCKVNTWREELRQLRGIVLASGLTEELKWSFPCYTYQQGNVLILSAFKEYCSLNFFKGALLSDPSGLLTKPGENTRAGRQLRITSVREVLELETTILAYIHEAIEIERTGLKVESEDKATLVLADELQRRLDADPALRAAFQALTPGRQRGYNLYFSAAKQSKTRESRIEQCIPLILAGKGREDR